MQERQARASPTTFARHVAVRALTRHLFADARPWHLEHGAHGDAHRAPVEGVVAARCHQHGIEAERSSIAEDGAYVRMVRYVLEHGDPARLAQQLAGCGRGRAPERGQRTARQLEAGQAGELIVRCGQDGRLWVVALEALDERALLFELVLADQERDGVKPRIHRALDHLRRFSH